MLPPALPDLFSLDVLSSVAELGSLGRAARRHGLSQPAVSARMKELESGLGVRLLDRSPTGTRVSEEARDVLRAVERVLVEVESLRREAQSLRDASSGRVRVAASLTVGEYLIPQWLRELARESSEVALGLDVVNSSRVVEQVVARRADLGFVEGPWEDHLDLEERVVGEDRLVIVVHPAHPWASRRRPLLVSDLAGVDLVTREPGSGTREVLEAALSEVGGVHTHVELGSTGALLGAARRGADPVVLSEIAAREDLESGRLVEVPTHDVNLTRVFRAIWRRDVTPTRLARRLLDVASRDGSWASE